MTKQNRGENRGLRRFVPYLVLFLFFCLYIAGFFYRSYLKKQAPRTPLEVILSGPFPKK